MSNAVRCVDCKEFSFRRDRRELAAQGYGNCSHRKAFIIYQAKRDRDCSKFKPAPADTVKERIDFLNRREVERGRTRH